MKLLKNRLFSIYLIAFLASILIPVLIFSSMRSTSEQVQDNFSIKKDFKPDNTINIPSKSGLINVRKRALSLSETAILNIPGQRDELHNKTWQGTLNHGDLVQLIATEGYWYRIKYLPRGSKILKIGYIAMYHTNGQSSLKPIKE